MDIFRIISGIARVFFIDTLSNRVNLIDFHFKRILSNFNNLVFQFLIR